MGVSPVAGAEDVDVLLAAPRGFNFIVEDGGYLLVWQSPVAVQGQPVRGYELLLAGQGGDDVVDFIPIPGTSTSHFLGAVNLPRVYAIRALYEAGDSLPTAPIIVGVPGHTCFPINLMPPPPEPQPDCI